MTTYEVVGRKNRIHHITVDDISGRPSCDCGAYVEQAKRKPIDRIVPCSHLRKWRKPDPRYSQKFLTVRPSYPGFPRPDGIWSRRTLTMADESILARTLSDPNISVQGWSGAERLYMYLEKDQPIQLYRPDGVLSRFQTTGQTLHYDKTLPSCVLEVQPTHGLRAWLVHDLVWCERSVMPQFSSFAERRHILWELIRPGKSLRIVRVGQTEAEKLAVVMACRQRGATGILLRHRLAPGDQECTLVPLAQSGRGRVVSVGPGEVVLSDSRRIPCDDHVVGRGDAVRLRFKVGPDGAIQDLKADSLDLAGRVITKLDDVVAERAQLVPVVGIQPDPPQILVAPRRARKLKPPPAYAVAGAITTNAYSISITKDTAANRWVITPAQQSNETIVANPAEGFQVHYNGPAAQGDDQDG